MILKPTTISKEEFEKTCNYSPLISESDGSDFMELFFSDKAKRKKVRLFLTADIGEGKTALMLKFGENFHYEHPEKAVYVYGFKNWRDLPEYFIPITEDNLNPLSKNCIKTGGIVLLDEANLNKPKDLSAMLSVVRHFDLHLIYAGQSVKQVTPTILGQLSGLIFKRPSDMEVKYNFTRKELRFVMKELQENVDKFDDLSNFYYDSLNGSGWYKSPLPSFWSDKVSKGYKPKGI